MEELDSERIDQKQKLLTRAGMVGRAEATAAKAMEAKVAMEAKERIVKRVWGRVELEVWSENSRE